MHISIQVGFASLLFIASANAYAWFFIFPIPNIAKPAALQRVIDALEKSPETRALAFLSEDKTFGSKYWVWGRYTGYVTQEEADRIATERCETSKRNAQTQSAGGQPLYDFGDKKCELHPFAPNEGPRIAETRRKAAEEEAKQIAAEEEAKRLAAAEEAKRIAAAEEAKRLAAEEEAKRLADAEEAKRQDELKRQEKAGQQAEARQQEEASRRTSKGGSDRLARVRSSAVGTIDFNAEARKSARILGCVTSDPKVVGVENKNILFLAPCSGGYSITLSCDPEGLCLKK